MKRALKIFGLLFLVLVVALVAIGVGTFGGMSEITDGKEIGSATTIKDGYVAAYSIDSGDGVILIDAGDDATGAALIAGLAKKNKTPDDVRAIFITHGHPDHVAGVSKFPKAAVYALDREVSIAEGREAAKGPIPALFGASKHKVHVTNALTSGSTLAIGNKTVQIFAIPGHTAGSAAYLIDGDLFVGDAASANQDGYLMGAPWIFSDDQKQNNASLIALAGSLAPRSDEVKWIVPAHTAPVAGLKALGEVR